MLNVSLRRIGLGGIFALSMVGFSLQSCSSLKPRSLQENTSSVSVAFDPTVLGDVAANMKTLQIRVFKVVNELTSTQEGGDSRLAIEQQKKDYTLEKISLGLKEIEISILNESDLALGTGKIRVLVRPGINKTYAVIIKIKKISNPVTTVALNFLIRGDIDGQDLMVNVKKVEFSWKTEMAAQSGVVLLNRGIDIAGPSQVTYDEIKSVLEGNCVSCHKEGLAKAKLKVDRFPFVSGSIANQADLMAAIMVRIQDVDAPMPPAALMAVDKIDLVKAWETGGFAKSAVASGSNSFTAGLVDMRTTDKLTGVVTLYGEGDVKLGEKEISPYIVEENGVLKQDVELTLPAPVVSIPIVVQPE